MSEELKDPVVEEPKRRKKDPEIEAMAKIAALLEGLDTMAQGRVVEWACNRVMGCMATQIRENAFNGALFGSMAGQPKPAA